MLIHKRVQSAVQQSSIPIAAEAEHDIAQAMALSARSVKSRVGFAALFALACSAVLTWPVVVSWLAVVITWESLGRPYTDRLLATGAFQPKLIWYAAAKCASAILFGALGGLALASGTPLGMIVGASWLIGSICHTFVYYGANRTILVATMSAAVFWAAVGAFAGFGFTLDAAIAFGSVLSTLSAGAIFLGDRKALLDALEHERLALAVAQQSNAAKSEFLATMSHELRTPLHAVIGYSEMLQETAAEDGRERDVEDHDHVLNASRHLLAMINEILDLSKLEAGKIILEPSNFSVEGVAREALDTIRPLATARGNRLHLDLGSENFGVVYNDALRLHQCLLNLLSNAVKFTLQGVITLRVRREGERVVFSVEDTGIGIAADTIAILFRPFVQADASITRTHGGAGLGLSISRRLARLMGGDVEARSVLGHGSTFTLSVLAQLETPPLAEPREYKLEQAA